VPTEHEPDRQPIELRHGIAKFLGRFGIGDGNDRALLGKIPRHADTAAVLAEPEQRHAQPGQIGRIRVLAHDNAIATPIRPLTMPTIQKRIAICVSGQPESSKW